MGDITALDLQWYAMRMRPLQNIGRKTAVLNCETETYRDKRGQERRRSIPGTGKRVFVHEHLLRSAGFDVFLPVRKDWRRINRFNPKKELVSYPLLTGWLFVGWPCDENRWPELLRLGIVSRVLGTNGMPARIKSSKVATLMQRWGGGMLAPRHYRWLRTYREFDEGDTVLVRTGSFDGFPLEVLEIGETGVRGNVKILGREVEVIMPSDLLEPIGTRS